eukprot:scaffold5613_cov133-Isochrysis_galbana.AAC.7
MGRYGATNSLIVPVEEEEREGRDDEEAEDEQPEVARVLRGRVDVPVPEHDVLRGVLRVGGELLDLVALLLDLGGEEVRQVGHLQHARLGPACKLHLLFEFGPQRLILELQLRLLRLVELLLLRHEFVRGPLGRQPARITARRAAAPARLPTRATTACTGGAAPRRCARGRCERGTEAPFAGLHSPPQA